MPNVKSIASNTSEDYIDELVSNITYKYSEFVFNGFDISKIKDGDSPFDEALEGALSTLKFSITASVMMVVTEYAMSKLVIISGAIFSYIKAGRFINKVRKAINETSILGFKVGRVGSTSIGMATKLAIGNQNERLAVSHMANNNGNNLASIVAQERQTQVMMKGSQRKEVNSLLNNSTKNRQVNVNKNLESYRLKMRAGTWTTSTLDKKLYLSVVPKESISSTFNFNATYVAKLNSLTEYAKSEDRIINLAQTHVDLLTTHNISKIK